MGKHRLLSTRLTSTPQTRISTLPSKSFPFAPLDWLRIPRQGYRHGLTQLAQPETALVRLQARTYLACSAGNCTCTATGTDLLNLLSRKLHLHGYRHGLTRLLSRKLDCKATDTDLLSWGLQGNRHGLTKLGDCLATNTDLLNWELLPRPIQTVTVDVKPQETNWKWTGHSYILTRRGTVWLQAY